MPFDAITPVALRRCVFAFGRTAADRFRRTVSAQGAAS